MSRGSRRPPAEDHRTTRTALGRADLVRLALALDDSELARLARGLGYREVEQPKQPSCSVPGPDTAPSEAVQATPSSASHRHRAYLLAERHQLTPRQSRATPPKRDPAPAATEPEPEPLPPAPPLVPWSRLWPLLRAALSALAERPRIDVPRLVAAQARLRPLRRLPRLSAPRWAPAGQLILDLNPRLYPFLGDFAAIKAVVPRLRGCTGLEILGMEQGPEGPVRVWDGEDWSSPRLYRATAADVPVLILGDLGCLGAQDERRAWERLGRRLRASGRQAVVLTPCPSRWWDPVFAGLYFPVVLDRAAHIPARPAGARPWPARAVDLAEAIRNDSGARRLLALLDACLAISPALLRHLRHRLSAGCADVGSEAAAWQHPVRLAGAFALLPGHPVESEQLQGALASTLVAEERRLAWDLIRAQQRAHGSSRAVRMEERIRQAALLGVTDDRAEAFQDAVADALNAARATGDRDQAAFLSHWVGRIGTRMSPSAWDFSPRTEALWVLANPQATTEGAVLPPGLDIHRALAAQGRSEQVRVWRIVQRGERWEVESKFPPEPTFSSGSPVVARIVTQDPVLQVREHRPDAPALSLPLRDSATLPLNERGWRIRTEHEELVIVRSERPDWAHTLGRDGSGLFVGFDDGQGSRRAYWWAPGPWGTEWLPARESPVIEPVSRDLEIKQGFFMDADQYKSLGREGLAPACFEHSAGIDAYGVRGEIRTKGVPIGLRWIWPGEFPMGSPEGEAGRSDDEARHRVILTRGFWLAETACTQALWEAVTGENPSLTKDPEHPVETVSWDDVQGFLERLNAELAAMQTIDFASSAGSGAPPDDSGFSASGEPNPPPSALRFRLPTEAEWEYACRAGTTTAYSFGEAFDTERANNGTSAVKVRSLPPNPWGLYGMHGNVWEWCGDWYGVYPDGPVVDPAGPNTGGGRVLRGGSWVYEARDLRSAYRSHEVPGHRNDNIGFRLALGPELKRGGDGKPAGSGTGQSAQGASRSERTARAVGSRGVSGRRTP